MHLNCLFIQFQLLHSQAHSIVLKAYHVTPGDNAHVLAAPQSKFLRYPPITTYRGSSIVTVPCKLLQISRRYDDAPFSIGICINDQVTPVVYSAPILVRSKKLHRIREPMNRVQWLKYTLNRCRAIRRSVIALRESILPYTTSKTVARVHAAECNDRQGESRGEVHAHPPQNECASDVAMQACMSHMDVTLVTLAEEMKTMHQSLENLVAACRPRDAVPQMGRTSTSLRQVPSPENVHSVTRDIPFDPNAMQPSIDFSEFPLFTHHAPSSNSLNN